MVPSGVRSAIPFLLLTAGLPFGSTAGGFLFTADGSHPYHLRTAGIVWGFAAVAPAAQLAPVAPAALIALNPRREEIYRFSGYSEPPAFLAELAESLRRWALYRAGRIWDEPRLRPARILDAGRLSTLPAPSEAVPSGMTCLDGRLWIAQGDTLYRLDPATGEVEARFAVDPHIRDLTTDGRLIYGVAYGWTAGEPIFVYDRHHRSIRVWPLQTVVHLLRSPWR